MRIRALEERDLELVRELRNRNRRSFFYDEEISAEQQRRWFADLEKKPIRFCVIEEEGQVVGTISVTDTPSGKEIGNLIIDERYRGRGLMWRALQQLTSEPGRYFCRVKPDNEASLRLFCQAGFVPEYVLLQRTAEGP